MSYHLRPLFAVLGCITSGLQHGHTHTHTHTVVSPDEVSEGFTYFALEKNVFFLHIPLCYLLNET